MEIRTVVSSWQRGSDAWLHNAMTRYNTANRLIKNRSIKWMGNFPDQPPCGITRQTRISIKGNDEAHVGRQRSRGCHKVCVDSSPQQSVKFMKLAALALPAHPLLLNFIPSSISMDEKKSICVVTTVQLQDSAFCTVKKSCVLRSKYYARIEPVRDKCKIQFTRPARKKMNFQSV